MNKFLDFSEAIDWTRTQLNCFGKIVPVGHWQGLDVKGLEKLQTHELFNYLFTCKINPDIEVLKEQIKPNLPWADDHFLERVGGKPLNPPPSHEWWPFNQGGNKDFIEGGVFTHTYPERIWPKEAEAPPYMHNFGIRYEYGDLDDVINLLIREPLTRQAFLPIWFPEDTGAVHKGRVPCTIGYHFMRRDDKLHIFYPIRACDFNRHFRDDIYLACRLLLWVLGQLKNKDIANWSGVEPGDLTMHIYSLHIFAGELHTIRGE